MSCRVGWGHVQKIDFLYFLKLESCACDVKRYGKISYSSMIEQLVPASLKPGGSVQKCSNIGIFFAKHLKIDQFSEVHTELFDSLTSIFYCHPYQEWSRHSIYTIGQAICSGRGGSRMLHWSRYQRSVKFCVYFAELIYFKMFGEEKTYIWAFLYTSPVF